MQGVGCDAVHSSTSFNSRSSLGQEGLCIRRTEPESVVFFCFSSLLSLYRINNTSFGTHITLVGFGTSIEARFPEMCKSNGPAPNNAKKCCNLQIFQPYPPMKYLSAANERLEISGQLKERTRRR
jgi:hypothetical protein